MVNPTYTQQWQTPLSALALASVGLAQARTNKFRGPWSVCDHVDHDHAMFQGGRISPLHWVHFALLWGQKRPVWVQLQHLNPSVCTQLPVCKRRTYTDCMRLIRTSAQHTFVHNYYTTIKHGKKFTKGFMVAAIQTNALSAPAVDAQLYVGHRCRAYSSFLTTNSHGILPSLQPYAWYKVP